MSMLTISNLGFAFGDYDVFLGISATIPNDGKIGLVGPNGIEMCIRDRCRAGLTRCCFLRFSALLHQSR